MTRRATTPAAGAPAGPPPPHAYWRGARPFRRTEPWETTTARARRRKRMDARAPHGARCGALLSTIALFFFFFIVLLAEARASPHAAQRAWCVGDAPPAAPPARRQTRRAACHNGAWHSGGRRRRRRRRPAGGTAGRAAGTDGRGAVPTPATARIGVAARARARRRVPPMAPPRAPQPCAPQPWWRPEGRHPARPPPVRGTLRCAYAALPTHRSVMRGGPSSTAATARRRRRPL